MLAMSNSALTEVLALSLSPLESLGATLSWSNGSKCKTRVDMVNVRGKLKIEILSNEAAGGNEVPMNKAEVIRWITRATPKIVKPSPIRRYLTPERAPKRIATAAITRRKNGNHLKR